MAYQVIARKWRPQRFSDMVGQEHIARTLRNAIISGRIAQAYLFVGPRGIGKTTAARIFAKALNCTNPQNGEPCCECESCKAIASESSVDVIEIDAATHTQVEKAREICEEVMHLPIASKYKIYIIDEVHMLSKSAWNALLKTIEEPPDYAKFIFATTEVNKVLPTVISRCQRFDLRRIPTNLISERLRLIAETEKVAISKAAIDVIARAADGGMRDAQSLLDQMISFFAVDGGSEITEEQALSLFGLTAPAEMQTLVQSLLCNEARIMITSIKHFADTGKNLEILFDEILVWLRGILMCSIMPNPESVIDEGSEKTAIYKKLAKTAHPGVLQRLLEQFSSQGFLLREAINKQVFIETLLMKGMRLAHAPQAGDLIARLNYIRKNGELAPLDAVPAYIDLPRQLVIQRGDTSSAAPSAQQAEPVVQQEHDVKKNSPPMTETPQEVLSPEPDGKPVDIVSEPEDLDRPSERAEEPPAPELDDVIEEIPADIKPAAAQRNTPHAAMPQKAFHSAPAMLSGNDDPDGDGSGEEDFSYDGIVPVIPEEKKKSQEELVAEVKGLPIIKEAVDMFEGYIADVHENQSME